MIAPIPIPKELTEQLRNYINQYPLLDRIKIGSSILDCKCQLCSIIRENMSLLGESHDRGDLHK